MNSDIIDRIVQLPGRAVLDVHLLVILKAS